MQKHQRYQNILFVSTGTAEETNALKQALSIARNNQARLSVLVIHPKFPSYLVEYEGKYETNLIEELRSNIRRLGQEMGVDTDSMALSIRAEKRRQPSVSIIKTVLKDSVDLVIKEAEENKGRKGFKALDMALLRQCPCPVWLCRPVTRSRQDIKVAVAIDAGSETEEGQDLARKLLRAADGVAQECGHALSIVSCWEYELEEYLQNNPWTKISESEISRIVTEAEEENFHALTNLLGEAEVTSKTELYNLRGAADLLIPKFVEENGIDILIMGTVGRSGILGFIIGNTAENIVQNIDCSLLALKPNGFVSPVTLY